MTLCNDRLQVMLTGTSTVHSVRCDMEQHGDDKWHRGPGGTRWKAHRREDFCQVEIGDGLLGYTCLNQMPCAEHTDFLPDGQGNDEGTDMGGTAHDADPSTATATASADEGTATATATAPAEATEDTSGETASADESSSSDSE